MGRDRRSVLAGLILVSSLWASQSAMADPKLEAAQKHFKQGQAYFKAGTFDKAIVEYQAAYDAAPRAALLFNIALCYENAGELDDAISYYDKYLEMAPDHPKTAEATARREALVRLIERRNADEAKQNNAANRRAAGNRAFGASDWDTAIAEFKASFDLVAEPEVVFELAEAYRAKGDTTLAKVEYERYLALASRGNRREEAARRLQELEASQQPLVVTPEYRPLPAEREARGSLLPGGIALGVAGVAATVGIVFGLKASSIASELDEELEAGGPPLDTGDPRYDEGRQAALTANISYGIAGVSGMVAAYLLYRAFDVETGPTSSGATVLVPTIDADHAGMALEVSF